MASKSNKRAWAVQVKDGIGMWCWLNYEHLRFATESHAADWIAEQGLRNARPARATR